MGEGSDIQVVVRCRPINDNEKAKGATRVVKISGDKVNLHNPFPSSGTKEHNFSYDHCYFWDVKTDQLFKDVGEPLLKRALEGYNVTLIAHGQIGSGKTHTLIGLVEEQGLLALVSQALFNSIEKTPKGKEYFATVSYLEVTDDSVRDLLNPSGRDLKVRQHPQLGIYVDDLAELVVSNHDDVLRLQDQGDRVSKFTVSDYNKSREKASTIFTITLEQVSKGNQRGKGLRSKITFVDLAGSNHSSQAEDSHFISKSIEALSTVVDMLNDSKSLGMASYRESRLTRVLQDSIGGNTVTVMVATISPTDGDFFETLSTLKLAHQMKNVKNTAKTNENDTTAIVAGLREEINRLRKRLTGGGIASVTEMPNGDDVERMEEMVKDLQIAKLQTWEEKQRVSEMFEDERRQHLSNRGILDWVLDSMKRESTEIQGKLSALQKDKDKYMIDYKEKRKAVDELKDTLQVMITEYSKLAETGNSDSEDGKQKVAEIHMLKEKLKHESENLKKIKQQLKDVQEKQKAEKEEAKSQTSNLRGNWELTQRLETEQREKLEKENQLTLADEMDRIKMETEQEKAEIKLKTAEGVQRNKDEVLNLEMELLDVKAEKAVMAIKLKSLDYEKKQLKKSLEETYKRHKEEQELQQLQHFQTFRNYREIFEEQKAALEQRYRTLLEDAIQDAIFLSSRNQELMEENQNVTQDCAELKDKLSMAGGRPMSPLTE